MRWFVTLLVFFMASVTIVGALLTLALAAPELGLLELAGLSGISGVGGLAGAGFLLAVPVSYVISGMIMRASALKR